MKNVITLLLCFFFVFLPKGNSQINPDEVVFVKGKYFYKNRIYKKMEADQLFMINEKAFDVYNSYRATNLTATRAGLASVILIPGSLLLVRFNPCAEDSDVCGFGTIGIFGFIAGIVTGGIAIGATPIAKIQFNKSINLLNDALKHPNDLGTIPVELNLGLTNNGVGFVINF